MAQEQKFAGAGTIKTEEFVKADPSKNPRNQAFKEIAAKRNAQADVEAAETMPQDALPEEFEPAPKEDSGVELNAGADKLLETPDAEKATTDAEKATDAASEGGSGQDAASEGEAEEGVEVVEPDAVYELTVDGKKVEVPGSKIIEAGIRTYQKEAAADVKLALANERLETASRLLAEAEQRRGALPQGAPTPGERKDGPKQDAPEVSEVDLAKAIQFGTEEQAAAAIKQLRQTGRAVTPEQVQGFIAQTIPAMVRQELALNEARQFAQTEYPDIMGKPLLKSLFDAMEMQARQNGDQTPPRELYVKIGDFIREQLGLAKPAPKQDTPTREQKVAAKKAAPALPRTAATRLEEGAGPRKAPTPSEVIARMAQLRGQGSLTQKPH